MSENTSDNFIPMSQQLRDKLLELDARRQGVIDGYILALAKIPGRYEMLPDGSGFLLKEPEAK